MEIKITDKEMVFFLDINSKFRSGNLTPDQLKWWLNQPKNTREAIMLGNKPATESLSPYKSTEKFALLVDLGIITVSDDYVREKRLTTFGKNLYYYDDKITDKNFPNPTRVLKPGDKLRVRAFEQFVGDTTTSEERMAFWATQKAIHTGAQGLSLVFEQKRDQLPKGKRYASFDEPDRFWEDADGRHGMPIMDCRSDGVFGFYLGYFEGVWSGDDAFLCFCDVLTIDLER